jgi:hypothetical protein
MPDDVCSLGSPRRHSARVPPSHQRVYEDCPNDESSGDLDRPHGRRRHQLARDRASHRLQAQGAGHDRGAEPPAADAPTLPQKSEQRSHHETAEDVERVVPTSGRHGDQSSGESVPRPWMDLHRAVGHRPVAEERRHGHDEPEEGGSPRALLCGSHHEREDQPGRGHLRGGRDPGPEPRHASEILVGRAEHETKDRCNEEGHESNDSDSLARDAPRRGADRRIRAPNALISWPFPGAAGETSRGLWQPR